MFCRFLVFVLLMINVFFACTTSVCKLVAVSCMYIQALPMVFFSRLEKLDAAGRSRLLARHRAVGGLAHIASLRHAFFRAKSGDIVCPRNATRWFCELGSQCSSDSVIAVDCSSCSGCSLLLTAKKVLASKAPCRLGLTQTGDDLNASASIMLARASMQQAMPVATVGPRTHGTCTQ